MKERSCKMRKTSEDERKNLIEEKEGYWIKEGSDQFFNVRCILEHSLRILILAFFLRSLKFLNAL
jgi:hypothetical protein